MEKKYILIWGDWEDGLHSYEPKSREHNGDFFTLDNGYDSDDIEQINELQPGETWVSSYGNHNIFRLS